MQSGDITKSVTYSFRRELHFFPFLSIHPCQPLNHNPEIVKRDERLVFARLSGDRGGKGSVLC
jgi:hypothetical protein